MGWSGFPSQSLGTLMQNSWTFNCLTPHLAQPPNRRERRGNILTMVESGCSHSATR